MATKRGSVALRLEPDGSGGMVASVIYRGPGGRRRLVNPSPVPPKGNGRAAAVLSVIEDGLGHVSPPYANKENTNGNG